MKKNTSKYLIIAISVFLIISCSSPQTNTNSQQQSVNALTEKLNDSLEKFISGGKNTMPAFNEILKPSQIEKISLYVKTLRK